jgi:hypothetical protein
MPVPVPEYDPIIPWWLTPLIAVWGAFLSTLMLGWNLYRDLTNRPKVIVKARVRRLVHLPTGQWYAAAPDLPIQGASQQLFVVMTLANVRSRPVRWVGWGGKYKTPVNGNPEFFIIPTHLPKMLNDGEDHSESAPIAAEGYPPDDNVKILRAWDSTGRDWKLSWWNMRKLHKEFKKALSQN